MPYLEPLPTIQVVNPETGEMMTINEIDHIPSAQRIWVEPSPLLDPTPVLEPEPVLEPDPDPELELEPEPELEPKPELKSKQKRG
jgi:hypothetical protein